MILHIHILEKNQINLLVVILLRLNYKEKIDESPSDKRIFFSLSKDNN
jgi:hypothetical protein